MELNEFVGGKKWQTKDGKYNIEHAFTLKPGKSKGDLLDLKNIYHIRCATTGKYIAQSSNMDGELTERIREAEAKAYRQEHPDNTACMDASAKVAEIIAEQDISKFIGLPDALDLENSKTLQEAIK